MVHLRVYNTTPEQFSIWKMRNIWCKWSSTVCILNEWVSHRSLAICRYTSYYSASDSYFVTVLKGDYLTVYSTLHRQKLDNHTTALLVSSFEAAFSVASCSSFFKGSEVFGATANGEEGGRRNGAEGDFSNLPPESEFVVWMPCLQRKITVLVNFFLLS